MPAKKQLTLHATATRAAKRRRVVVVWTVTEKSALPVWTATEERAPRRSLLEVGDDVLGVILAMLDDMPPPTLELTPTLACYRLSKSSAAPFSWTCGRTRAVLLASRSQAGAALRFLHGVAATYNHARRHALIDHLIDEGPCGLFCQEGSLLCGHKKNRATRLAHRLLWSSLANKYVLDNAVRFAVVYENLMREMAEDY